MPCTQYIFSYQRFTRSASVKSGQDYDLVNLGQTVQSRYVMIYSIEGKAGEYGADDDLKCLRLEMRGCFPGVSLLRARLHETRPARSMIKSR